MSRETQTAPRGPRFSHTQSSTAQERKKAMTPGKALNGKPYAGNPHVRFDEGKVASAVTPRRGALLYKVQGKVIIRLAFAAMAICVMTIIVYVWNSSGTTITYQDADAPSRNEEDLKKPRTEKSVNPSRVRRDKPKNSSMADGTKGSKELGIGKKTGNDLMSADVVVVEGAKDGVKPSMAGLDVTQPVMEELCAVFSKVSSEEPDADLAKTLASYKPAVVLDVARSVMKNGSSNEKKNALYAVGLLFGRDSDTGVPFDITHPKSTAAGNDGEIVTSSGTPSEKSELGVQLFSTVSAGLSDSDAGVRTTAFDVMRTLPDEDGSALAATLLSDGDVDLQKRLMREVEGNASGIRLSLMGMGSESEAVRTLAAENLESISGQKFAGQKEAAEWYEAHQNEFPHNAGNGGTTSEVKQLEAKASNNK